MANKMLIDAAHPEETRVVVLRGNRVEEFDFETAQRKQLRGNIYLAKVTRVEPSLQAAFIDYGGNRHGFLAFSEIHPDYYQIPVADRQALLEDEARAHEEEQDERRGRRHRRRGAERRPDQISSEKTDGDSSSQDDAAEIAAIDDTLGNGEPYRDEANGDAAASPVNEPEIGAPKAASDTPPAQDNAYADAFSDQPITGQAPQEGAQSESSEHDDASGGESAAVEDDDEEDDGEEEEVVESVGGDSDAMEEIPQRAPRYRRQYKIQEVIKRRQVMLVQVVKEERGTKGAALTTYLSLAGRYSVLMPNTARGGGISRKITSAEDRRRLKEIAEELQVPEGMGVILRTAGASRTPIEVKRDFEYLMRLWETVRDLTLKSQAPQLVYEEGSLVKRSIRDLYNKEIDEILVSGDAAYQEAKDFMRMLMPGQAKTVQPYRSTLPLLARYGIEAQLDAMFQPTVQLKSGGYIVINQTEALVAIDVNSGRSTREHSIEDTAVKTNSEAAVEIARQLRLRDLAGLIVIDFIDMDEKRNNRSVEKRVKDALKIDRARIQVGRISHFGLLEMSRQRIRSSVLESSTETCAQCGGTGHVRSVSSVALQLLRAIEETLLKGATHNLIVRTRSDVALYVLNHKRAHLRALEERFRILLSVNADATMTGQPAFAIDRGEQVMTLEQARQIAAQTEADQPPQVEEEEDDYVEDNAELAGDEPEEGLDGEATEANTAEGSEDGTREPRRRRRGRRGRGRKNGAPNGDSPQPVMADGDAEAGTGDADEGSDDDEAEGEEIAATGNGTASEGENGDPRRRRRRGRRGGRRSRRNREGGAEGLEQNPGEVAGENGHDNGDAAAVVLNDDNGATLPVPAPSPTPSDVAPRMEAAPQVSGEREPQEQRRRSTIREAAPMSGDFSASPSPAAHMPEPQPEADSEPAAQEDEKPRKLGWWSRKT